MRSCTFEKEERGFNPIDEEPVWFDVAFAMVAPFAGEMMVSIPGWQWFLCLKEVDDGFEFVDIVTALFSELEILEKTVGGFDEEQDLGASVGSECSKVLEGRQFLGMFAFFKGIQRVSVWNHDRKGNTLVEFYLSVEKAYSLGFGNAEAVEDLDGLLFQSSVDTSVDAIGHGHMFGLSHAQIVRHLSCEGKMFVYVRVQNMIIRSSRELVIVSSWDGIFM